jgi:hypothetical protein
VANEAAIALPWDFKWLFLSSGIMIIVILNNFRQIRQNRYLAHTQSFSARIAIAASISRLNPPPQPAASTRDRP